MKLFSSILLVLLYSSDCYSQAPEFTVNNNGLIYSDQTINQLKRIVDSLNLKFKSCDLHKTYYSQVQGRAHYVELEENVKAALKDIKAGISLEDFLRKYPGATVIRDIPVVKYQYENYKGKRITTFGAIDLNDITPSIGYEEPQTVPEALKNSWLYEYYKSSDGTDESLQAFIPIEDFNSIPISLKYARLIQYSDCLIDTNSTILLQDAKEDYELDKEKASQCMQAFFNHLATMVQNPEYNGDEEKYESEYRRWDSMRFVVLDKEIRAGLTRELFNDALSEALKTGLSTDEFEEYVTRYASPAHALQLKRMRKVFGRCSQDSRPREHAWNIAMLSAESINWEVFLRAHLDIMNDRFERVADASYAYARRETYLKELEVLDINVHDLLFGISFRLENPSQNHYLGNIGRIGRALAETKDPDAVESRIMEMIKDAALDDYNRCIMYFLFTHYTYHLQDGPRREANKEKVKQAAASLPHYISAKMKPVEW